MPTAKLLPAMQRADPTGVHLRYLDGWRGIAILLVLIDHFTDFNAIGAGRLGVDLFFVLSGLLMSKILYVRRMPLSTFYRRRISRIIPAFLFYVMSIFFVCLAFEVPFEWSELPATLTFVRTYVPTIPIWQSAAPIQHVWSLNVEEHCYLLLALLVALSLQRLTGSVLLLLGFATIGAQVWYLGQGPAAPIDYQLRTECAATCLLCSAGYHLYRQRFTSRVAPWMPVVALLLAVPMYLRWAPWYQKYFFAPFLLAFAVNHLEQASAWLRTFLSNPVLSRLGIWSYSIYLWQQPFNLWKGVFPSWLPIWLTACMALMSFYLVESPARGWLNSRWIASPAWSSAHQAEG